MNPKDLQAGTAAELAAILARAFKGEL